MERIWWTQVTNAAHFINEIKQCVLDEKNILIRNAGELPWRDQFRDTIVESVSAQNGEKKFEKIASENEPGEYLLNEFCKKEKRAEYRPSKGYARFLAESNDIVVHDRYFWVVINDKTLLESWMNFVSDYQKERGKGDNKAVFVLEYSFKDSVSAKKGIKSFILGDYIGDYDRIVFGVLAASGIKESAFIKQYVAELLANTVENDIELAAECINEYMSFIENPYGCIESIVESRRRSNGTDFIYDKTQESVTRAVWLSQIRTIYPFIEEFREGFVQQHSSAIAKELPIKSAYDELYEDPKDVELGTLIYMAGNGLLTLNNEQYNRLKRFKEARNKLSHLSTLSIDEIRRL